jgi:hypothetical protein
MERKTKTLYIVIAILVLVIIAIYIVMSKNRSSETKVDSQKTESTRPPGFSENPTEEEVYNSEYIKHIRTGLNAYLDGTNNGVDEYAIKKSNLDSGKKCGLDNFDKSYYKSKFIVLSAKDSDIGGVQADLFFIDKPDTIFLAWVYKTENNDKYNLRAFCESSVPIDTKDPGFKDFIKGMIKESKYSL